jgi:O-antigen/teichoic acid export membrane protein
MDNFLSEEKNDVKEIWQRIRKKDFSGNSGQAIKNSVYQFSTSLVSKIGSLIFTIILARLLLPELFGLYSLALSVILIFAVFSELGISSALVKYVSNELGKENKKLAESYLTYFRKIKLMLIFISIILLAIFSNFIANTLYQKPIFLALLAGIFYIIFIELVTFFESIFQAYNNFKKIFYKEILLQTLRISFVSVGVLLSLKYSLQSELILMIIILSLSLALFFCFIFMLFNKRKNKGETKLSSEEKKGINKFILATSVIAISGIFFSYIDKIMLGYFVGAEFIGYYTAAISLIGALSPLIGFSAIVLLPVFSRLKGNALENGFKKSIRLTFLISLTIFAITISFSYFIIWIIYGTEYILAANILRLLSPLIFTIPLIALYNSYFISQGKPAIINKFLIFSTLVNVTLNYFLISYLLTYGQLYAVYGAAIATIISQIIYLSGLVIGRKN